MILGMCACGRNASDSQFDRSETTGITVKDMAGDTVTLDSRADEIICTWPSGTQLMITLGMSELLVGVPNDSKELAWAMHIAPEVKNVRSCSNEESVESLLQIGADLVITTEADVARDLRSKGVNAITLKYYSVDEMKQAISLLGNIIPEEYGQKCTDYLRYLDEQIELVDAALDGKLDKKVSLYYIHGNNNKGLYKTAGRSTMNEAWANYAYTDFATSDLLASSETEVNAEAILNKNPDIIVIGGRYQRILKESLLNAPEWSDVNACVNNRIYLAPLGVSPFDRFGAEFAMMIPWVASQAYPELFSYDIEKEVKYFYQTFSGYTLTDDEVSYIVNGLKPDGTPEIENAK
jgi:iron complex transport system substrate-binding protein